MYGVRGLVNRWWHWGHRGARERRTVCDFDITFVRCFEEVDYHRLLSSYVNNS